MDSRAEAYLPVQRIAQACLECRYGSCIFPHPVVAGVILILGKAEEMPL